ncbi:MAG: hypothetical protein Q8P67_20295 [archaeon]|nr:hypothetical protein [archaeon]
MVKPRERKRKRPTAGSSGPALGLEEEKQEAAAAAAAFADPRLQRTVRELIAAELLRVPFDSSLEEGYLHHLPPVPGSRVISSSSSPAPSQPAASLDRPRLASLGTEYVNNLLVLTNLELSLELGEHARQAQLQRYQRETAALQEAHRQHHLRLQRLHSAPLAHHDDLKRAREEHQLD